MDTKYVNVFFKAHHANLNDMDLLRYIRHSIEIHNASITSYPVAEHFRHTYTIEVTGIFRDQHDIYDAAGQVVYCLMRDLPMKGLPFERRMVF
ncbi:hypothetical protein N7492_003186 [Penicillium capsulatum]|uniref:Uncharacterized protein n=1 Tax=Penicillium capsulatum TaxID=69766 RepID=A0A9W9IMP0_9EURO|nr:hypothetical protein N7492_003186 [Penicillium capsulatum]